jgi:hypothetical protein
MLDPEVVKKLKDPVRKSIIRHGIKEIDRKWSKASKEHKSRALAKKLK